MFKWFKKNELDKREISFDNYTNGLMRFLKGLYKTPGDSAISKAAA